MKLNTILAIGVGLGLALFPIRNPAQPLLHYFYLPTVAYCLFGICVFLFAIKSKKIDFGSKWVYIPLLVILGATVIRFIFFGDKNGLPFIAIAFVLYLIGYKVGDRIFRALIPFAIISIVSVIYAGIKYGDVTGNYILMGYNLGLGYLTFAAVINQGKWQWLLVVASVIGIYFTGSTEAIFVLGILFVAILVRSDWSKKLWYPLGIVVSLIIIFTITGHTQSLYNHMLNNLNALPTMASNSNSLNVALTGRLAAYDRAINSLTLFGHGFEINRAPADMYSTVHNVPLIIVDQIGVFAGMAWLIVSVYCLVKTKWKYAWIAVLSMSLFDHFIWTHLAPFWWVLVGVSTSSQIKNDMIFKEV
jgi:hypothetical protein